MAWGGGLTGLGQLMSVGAGLGKAYQDYQEQQQRQRQQQLQLEEFKMRQDQQRRQLEAMSLAGQGLQGISFGQQQPPAQSPMAGPPPGAQPASSPGLSPDTMMPPVQTASAAPPMSGRDIGGGMRAGGALDRTLDTIERDESGYRNIPNYRYDPKHTAGGNFQITDSTWRDTARGAGINTQQYPNAMSAPYPVQRAAATKLLETRGTQPWADFNPKLKADLAKGGDGEFIGQLAQAGGKPQQAQALAPVASSMGGDTLEQYAANLRKLAPNADPATLMMAMEMGIKTLSPIEQERFNREKWLITEQRHTQEFGERQDDRRLQRQQMQQNREETQQYHRDSLDVQRGRAEGGWTTMEMTGPDGKKMPVRVQAGTGTVEPLKLPEGGTGLTKTGTGAQAAPDPSTVDYVSKAIARYDMAPLSGWAMRSPYGQQVMSKVMQYNPEYDQTKYQQKQRGAIAFTSGRQGDSVRSFSVAIDHLAVMDEAAQALASNDTQALNRVEMYAKRELGYEGPVDFNFVKSIVGSEVSKAVIGGVGGVTDREELRNSFDLANSPEQLAGVARFAKKLMAGQLGGYRRQGATAGFSQDDFDKALSPRAKQELETLGGAGVAPTGDKPPIESFFR